MSLKRIRRWWIRQNPRPALNDLDRKLEKYLNFRNGFYIEVGANDGYSQSNTYYLEKKRGWTGLLVEGIPELYEECKRNRPRSVVRHCALVSKNSLYDTVTMHYANLMSVVEGALRTENEQARHLSTARKIQNLTRHYSIQVPARPLEAILDELVLPSEIDFFSLDVEGCELDVLQGMNLNKYRPIYILVEARFFDEIDSFLLEKQYRLVSKLTYHDYLYERKSST